MPATAPSSPDFLDQTTIGTMGGATAAVVAVCVVFRKAFKINHPLVPLIASFIISFALAVAKGSLNDPIGWVICIVNGCILFCAATGANETAAYAVTPRPAGEGEPQGGKPMPLFKSIFDR
jgi:hypothetical protein